MIEVISVLVSVGAFSKHFPHGEPFVMILTLVLNFIIIYG